MPTNTRVLVHDVPPLLADIVRGAIAAEPTIELLPDKVEDINLGEWRRPQPDVVVVSTPSIKWISNVGAWLRRWPLARIVVIEVSGRHAVVYELQPHAMELGELSPEQLVSVIRDSPDK